MSHAASRTDRWMRWRSWRPSWGRWRACWWVWSVECGGWRSSTSAAAPPGRPSGEGLLPKAGGRGLAGVECGVLRLEELNVSSSATGTIEQEDQAINERRRGRNFRSKGCWGKFCPRRGRNF
eukprot:354127-Chlamydomonas_euryale.AAC.2